MTISPLAYVSPQAKIGAGVVVEPFAYVGADVEIGEDTWVGPHATIFDGARIGKQCRIFPAATIAAIPQDLKFKGEYSTVKIGDNTTLRECTTVNRGTLAKQITSIGSDCLIMAYAHVAHDCEIHNHVILGNCVQLAGEVEVDDYAILSGGTLVHQFTRVGKHVMVQGGTKVNKDVPPYVIAGREPIMYCGLNVVGLRRRLFPAELIQEIQEAYRLLYREGMNISQGIERIVQEMHSSPELDEIIKFVQRSERGLLRGGKIE